VARGRNTGRNLVHKLIDCLARLLVFKKDDAPWS
jgi:hypothetical protein